MLRDKFIHYFQQWRERQLSRGEHWLAQHLAGRSPREKGMLLAAVVFLFSVGYYVLIWQPLSERIEQQETILQQLVAMNTRLKNAAPDIIAARKSATTTPAQVSRVISDSASAHSVVIRRIAGGTVMRVEQNNFRDMFSVYLSGPPQTQHVFCVSPAARVAHTGLAGEEWLKAFPLQAFQYGDGGDVRIVLASGRVFIFPENPRHIVHQFFVCQRTVTAYLVRITKTTG